MKHARTKKSHGASRSATTEAGFALIVTVTLLSFLALLLVSVMAITRTELLVSSGNQQLIAARQNALVGLDLALGQLQLAAGPDRRVTAPAESNAGNSHVAAVWDATASDILPMTWLMSGNESPNLSATDPDQIVVAPITLLGARTSDRDDDVVVSRREIRTAHLPGLTNAVTNGHFAWFVADQGVKAPLVGAHRPAEISYSPFDSAESKRRLSQQLAIGVGPDLFELRDSANLTLSTRLLTLPQAAFLQAKDGNRLGLSAVRSNFHRWSINNFAVLADPRAGGLRRDLSIYPDALGSAFAAWTDYSGYMENPANPLTPEPQPAYPPTQPQEALRRRYKLCPVQTANGIVHGIAPVLSHFLLTFNLRTDQSNGGTQRPMEARARWMTTLWNPYTSALIPEDLQLEISGLPTVQVIDDSAGGVTVATIPLDDVYGSPLKLHLPWQNNGRADQQSWLPGRVYSWTSVENTNKASPVPTSGFAGQFYVKNFNVAGQGVQRAASSALVSNAAQCHLLVNQPTRLTVRLFRQPGNARQLLATFHAPLFEGFTTTPAVASSSNYQFSFFFRLLESIDTVATPEVWLTTPGQDPREANLPDGSYMPGANGNRPEQYANFAASSFPDRLLDRSFPANATSLTGQSYNEDTCLFELPRAPVLSLGALQHVRTAGTRPWAIGNSWGGTDHWNALFDRYFFSGIAREVALPALVPSTPLPNLALQLLAQGPSGADVTKEDLQARAVDGFTSSYLLQGAAFNLNSTEKEAWYAVLRSGRRTSDDAFIALKPTPATGTASDPETLSVNLPGATFFRFSQSAQETFRANAGYAASTTSPPTGPNVASLANTHLFRNGVRTLSDDQTRYLAEAIVTLVALKRRASGPFTSAEDFLNTSPLFVAENGAECSLLEKAIELAHLNRDIAEFSSQWLTQGDIMTVLAPVLFVRSDTFLIRTYGDTVNPLTGAIEGRAWAEAMAQRVPDYVDPSQAPQITTSELNPINGRFGRRFKIVSFRWLTAFDL